MTKLTISGSNTPSLREQDLLLPVARYAKRKGYSLQTVELPFYDYRIDLYGFSTRTRRTVAVELKIKKWKRALEQALIYQLCSDFVFIALPLSATSRVDVAELRANGIGLIGVCGSRCRTLLEAEPSGEVRQHYRKPYIEILRGARNGHS